MIAKIIQFIFNRRKKILAFLLISVGLFLLSTTKALAAVDDEGGAITRLITWILSGINTALGNILVFLIQILVKVASYNGFITSIPVNNGWTIVRDLCNMFVILFLLIIAFCTILQVEQYSAKRMLAKLLIAAVLINFSKMIFGLLIDFSQVIMLTFISGFAANGAAQFVSIFQIDHYLSLEKCDAGGENINTTILLGAFAGTIAMVITTICVVVLLAILIMRVVFIWISIIFSPIYFLLRGSPFGGSYASQIFTDFSKQLITGPVLAFFIWLALVTGAQGRLDLLSLEKKNLLGTTSVNDVNAKKIGEATTTCGGTSLFTDGAFQNYLVVIALLMGGLMAAQKAGGAGAGMAGKGLGWAKTAAGAGIAASTAAWAGKKVQEAPGNIGRATLRTGLRGSGALVSRVGDGKGGLRDTIAKVGVTTNTLGNDMVKARQKELTKKRQKTLEKLGFGDDAMEKIQELGKDPNIKRVTGIVKGGVAGLALGPAGMLGSVASTVVGGSLGFGGQKAREWVGGKLESWAQGKIDANKATLKPHEEQKGQRQAQAENDYESRVRAVNDNTANEIRRYRNTTTVGNNLMKAERALDEYRNDRRGIKTSEATSLRSSGWSEEDIEKHQKGREQGLASDLAKAQSNFEANSNVQAVRSQHKEDMKNVEDHRQAEHVDIDREFDINTKGIAKDIEHGMVGALKNFGKYAKNYDPNHLTWAAAKQATEQTNAAKKKRDGLASGDMDLERFSQNDFCSETGVTSGQQKLFEKLSDGSKEAADAINNMAKSLSSFANGMKKPTPDQQKAFLALKQLLAAQLSSGRGIDHMTSVIGHLDRIDTGDKKGRQKVEEFVEKTK